MKSNWLFFTHASWQKSKGSQNIWCKGLFDNQSETQDDVFESDQIKKNKSVIIWAMDSYDFVKEKPGNTYNIKVEFRSGSDGDYNDETIESFVVSKGTQKKDIDTLQKAIDLFFKNGGKKKDLTK